MVDTGFTVAPATPADVEAIMGIESDPAYQGLVGHWPREQHLAEMARPSSRYFALRSADGDVAGFAMVQRLDDPDRKAHLKRIAVRETGSGAGTILLRAVVDWVYANTDTNRLDLDVFLDNDRARRCYEKAGFQVEGVLRDYHLNADGSFSSQWLMSILRQDWEAARA
jgi:RimJ/RimL family protein N-acetyltransferase